MLFRPEVHTQADAIFGKKPGSRMCHPAMQSMPLFGGMSGPTIVDAQTVSKPRVSSQSVTADRVAFHSARAWAA